VKFLATNQINELHLRAKGPRIAIRRYAGRKTILREPDLSFQVFRWSQHPSSSFKPSPLRAPTSIGTQEYFTSGPT